MDRVKTKQISKSIEAKYYTGTYDRPFELEVRLHEEYEIKLILSLNELKVLKEFINEVSNSK